MWFQGTPTFLKYVNEDFWDIGLGNRREHKIDPEIIGIYFSLNKEEYTTGTSGASSYMQKRAYDNICDTVM